MSKQIKDLIYGVLGFGTVIFFLTPAVILYFKYVGAFTNFVLVWLGWDPIVWE